MLDNHDHLKACEDLGFLDVCGLDAVRQICERRLDEKELPVTPSSHYLIILNWSSRGATAQARSTQKKAPCSIRHDAFRSP